MPVENAHNNLEFKQKEKGWILNQVKGLYGHVKYLSCI